MLELARITEDQALENLAARARLSKLTAGRVLIPDHWLAVLCLERAARQYRPHWDEQDIYDLIASRIARDLTPRQIQGILVTCSYIIAYAEVCHAPLQITDYNESQFDHYAYTPARYQSRRILARV